MPPWVSSPGASSCAASVRPCCASLMTAIRQLDTCRGVCKRATDGNHSMEAETAAMAAAPSPESAAGPLFPGSARPASQRDWRPATAPHPPAVLSTRQPSPGCWRRQCRTSARTSASAADTLAAEASPQPTNPAQSQAGRWRSRRSAGRLGSAAAPGQPGLFAAQTPQEEKVRACGHAGCGRLGGRMVDARRDRHGELRGSGCRQGAAAGHNAGTVRQCLPCRVPVSLSQSHKSHTQRQQSWNLGSAQCCMRWGMNSSSH